MPQKTPERDIREVALNLLARREHSRLELHHKLTQRGYDSAQVLAVLDQLIADDWLSEQRFAEVYASNRADKGYGPLRIRRELRERGIDDDIITTVLKPLADLWQINLRKLYQRRFESPKDLADQAKQQRFLRHRGFTHDQIQHALRQPD